MPPLSTVQESEGVPMPVSRGTGRDGDGECTNESGQYGVVMYCTCGINVAVCGVYGRYVRHFGKDSAVECYFKICTNRRAIKSLN